MGPAYPLMVVTLMLNPDKDTDQDHFRAVLAMLEQMDSRTKAVAPYWAIRDRLLSEWNAARMQVGKEALNLELTKPETANETDPQGAGIRLLIEVFARVMDNGFVPAFTPEMWAQAEEISAELMKNSTTDVKLPNGADLRHVLNAGWLARIHPDHDPEIPSAYSGERTGRSLTKAVEALRNQLPRKVKK
jgi:hypothetical protein